MKRFASRSLLVAAPLAALLILPAQGAIVVEDFEGYDVDTFPSAWTDVENAQSTSPRVRDNANNLSGQHLEFSSPYYGDASYAYESITMPLPVSLANDGDYIQVAAMLPSTSPDIVGGWMLLLGGPYPGGTHTYVGAVGLESLHGQFMHDKPDSLGYGTDFGAAALDAWYFLRATMRDTGGAPGVIDAYDFQVFTDEAGTDLVAEKLGIAFVGGEGGIGHIALKIYPQSGDPHGVVLFDSITMQVVPEPASLGLLALAAPLLLRRRADR